MTSKSFCYFLSENKLDNVRSVVSTSGWKSHKILDNLTNETSELVQFLYYLISNRALSWCSNFHLLFKILNLMMSWDINVNLVHLPENNKRHVWNGNRRNCNSIPTLDKLYWSFCAFVKFSKCLAYKQRVLIHKCAHVKYQVWYTWNFLYIFAVVTYTFECVCSTRVLPFIKHYLKNVHRNQICNTFYRVCVNTPYVSLWQLRMLISNLSYRNRLILQARRMFLKLKFSQTIHIHISSMHVLFYYLILVKHPQQFTL